MHIKPKKRLGQNFLFDGNIQRKIIAACGFKNTDIVLELGAGRGELTGLIAARVEKVFAIEIDSALCEIARGALKGFPNAEVICADILKFDFKKFFKESKVKVIGNIPYYISSPIIERLVKFRDNITEAHLSVQKEFARRMAASSGSKDYGSFSCFVQYYTQAQVIFNIKKNSFFPVPQVDSSLVRLKMRKEPAVYVKDEKLLFKTIRAAFNKRRKTLKNSLEGVVSRDKLGRYFKKYAIDPRIRGEELALQDFANINEA
ncbi:MAG: 16S rRNA (adenine(1518)-N(6)/adenine(1519)-N(6))-dimethyltransferase RsmA [Candidatus Omnitrophota bacterium]|nr:16S rRNA (adenine(1518)-N(6)/adenine(1519)-N(6))-dimethyltransferase RsmA [Candidatus Omnitrophota bacterium]